MRTTGLIAGGTALAASLAIAGCGTKVIDQGKLQSAIEKAANTQSHVKLKVSCPKDRDAKKNDRFDCTASLPDGKKVPVHVVQTDANGNVHFRLDPSDIPH